MPWKNPYRFIHPFIFPWPRKPSNSTALKWSGMFVALFNSERFEISMVAGQQLTSYTSSSEKCPFVPMLHLHAFGIFLPLIQTIWELDLVLKWGFKTSLLPLGVMLFYGLSWEQKFSSLKHAILCLHVMNLYHFVIN